MSTLKSLVTKSHPGGLRGVLGVLAIAWGTTTVSKISADAHDQAEAAQQHLELLQGRLDQTRAELDKAEGQVGEVRDIMRDEVVEAIREGHFDAEVKARASAVGWAGPAPAGPSPKNPFTPDALAAVDHQEKLFPRPSDSRSIKVDTGE